MDARDWRPVIAAAQDGDGEAMERLVAGWLPLVYNVVGRALNGHADVDDIVQETMLRAVHSLTTLRDPDRFRSWLVAIAMSQIRERARRSASDAIIPAAGSPADPAVGGTSSDFAELTVLKLQLEGQRREIAEAARWLDAEDRRLFSLWWLESSGELSRRELAASLGLTRAHTAVRVQRMKERLETARGIVRVLDAPPARCGGLRELLAGWDGSPGSLWRKRLARHIRGCHHCGARPEGLVPAERLLVGLALVPLPVGITFSLSLGLGGKAAAATAAASAGGWSAKALAVVGKPAAAVTAGAAIAAGGGALLVHQQPAPPPRHAAPATSTPPSTVAPPQRQPSQSATSPSPRPARYGTVVDAADRAPDPDRPPGPLPRRAERGLTSTGGPHAVLTHRGESVTLRGTGYVRVRWQLVPHERPGALVPPTWTGLEGRLFHVASGGGRRMDDPDPGRPDASAMGSPATGYIELPDGTQQMWQNEYFWLDGSVTFHQNERGADYNFGIKPTTWREAEEDVSKGPDPQAGSLLRYGLVRDTGDNRTPVPQYVTRGRPADPATVPQRSRVG